MIAFVVGLMIGGSLGVVLMGALVAWRVTAWRQQLAELERALATTQANMDEAVRVERKEASRWRDRALLCEEKGPTCGEVDEVFKENVRLKAKIAVLEGEAR